MCVFLQHPNAPVTFEPPPADPREQAVIDKWAYAAPASDDTSAALPQPGVSEPIYVQALRGTLPAETCAACALPTAQHYDCTGILWVGCDGARARQHLQLLTRRPLRDLTVWGDLHPEVSRAIRDALLVACGPKVAQWYDAELCGAEAMDLSRRLAELAVSALRRAEAKR